MPRALHINTDPAVASSSKPPLLRTPSDSRRRLSPIRAHYDRDDPFPTSDNDSFSQAAASPSDLFLPTTVAEAFPSPKTRGRGGRFIPLNWKRYQWTRKTGRYLQPSARRIFSRAPLLGSTITVLVLVVLYISHEPTRNTLSSVRQALRPASHSPLGAGGDSFFSSDPDHLPPLSPVYLEVFPPSLLTAKHRLLARKLHAFLGRPILSHEEAHEANLAGCPERVSGQLVNPDQYNGEIGFWREVGAGEIVRRRSEVVRFLSGEVDSGRRVVWEENMGSGRGIVLTGGNQDTTLRLITVLRHLKRLKVDLPIEVFHYPDELHELEQREQIEDLGGILREIKGVEKDEGAWKNWQIKGLSLVQSSFKEILYLDSDNIPLRNPSHLFNSPLYLSSGRAVFWPDLSKDSPDNAIWRLMGDTCTLDHWTFESGQIVIDKSGNLGLNLAALVIAAGMQKDRDFWFHMCGGDKDTFRWAFRVLDIPWGNSPRWMGTVGSANAFDGRRYCGHTVLQHDIVIPKGFTREPPLFVHSNLLKHLGSGGLSKSSLFTHSKRMHNDTYSNPELNHARIWVYHAPGRGMCLDVDWHGTAADDLNEDQRERNFPQMMELGEEEGNVFAGFAEAWFDEGGRIGGW